MKYLLCLILLGATYKETVYTECHDLIELNHFYDEQAKLVFDQIIFYDWSYKSCRYDVVAWRLIKNPHQIPFIDYNCNLYCTFWQDGNQLRKVYGNSFRETWLQYDPDILEQQHLPKEKRKELRFIMIKSKPTNKIDNEICR